MKLLFLGIVVVVLLGRSSGWETSGTETGGKVTVKGYQVATEESKIGEEFERKYPVVHEGKVRCGDPSLLPLSVPFYSSVNAAVLFHNPLGDRLSQVSEARLSFEISTSEEGGGGTYYIYAELEEPSPFCHFIPSSPPSSTLPSSSPSSSLPPSSLPSSSSSSFSTTSLHPTSTTSEEPTTSEELQTTETFTTDPTAEHTSTTSLPPSSSSSSSSPPRIEDCDEPLLSPPPPPPSVECDDDHDPPPGSVLYPYHLLSKKRLSRKKVEVRGKGRVTVEVSELIKEVTQQRKFEGDWDLSFHILSKHEVSPSGSFLDPSLELLPPFVPDSSADTYFEIADGAQDVITITNPTSASGWGRHSVIDITWDYDPLQLDSTSKVKITLYRDINYNIAEKWGTIATGIPLWQRTARWNMGDEVVTGDQWYIFIETDDGAFCGRSENFFINTECNGAVVGRDGCKSPNKVSLDTEGKYYVALDSANRIKSSVVQLDSDARRQLTSWKKGYIPRRW
eukprot:CAMPEP_0174258624 /NCGR_PEP_ID=MMETSP0439-20130205/7584_1 /TAXON_ID=0 /ORGANISM="Stereomyxa ramosa, Strain Chinc5" /LENGTH=506 /DNA_ID=CAMNT_0015342199 /DNA_START=31 /DNA_END=1548 /DNA_ORIENTATION=-